MSRDILVVLVMAGVTYALRLSPFVLFGQKGETPAWISYLGKYLPPAVMGMLIIYSLKHIQISVFEEVIPVVVAISITVALHLWKRNNLISIIGGTFFYMMCVQFLF
jgi:branched-subunit amino acid transport protein AzlD